jgi:flagellar biosynthesis protein FlhG
MVKVLSERKNARIGVVVNMASNDREGGETFDRLNALVVKFLHRSLVHFGTLPHHREVAQYVRRQRLLLLDKGNTFFARRIKEIARRIYGIPVRENRGIFERLLLRAD